MIRPSWKKSGQSLWIEEGCFKADPASEKPAYSVVIPPPNVTGVLHLGHVLNNTIQDILVRRARQKGYEALWLPGTDHAGIATQVRVEKDLRQTTCQTRHDVGREALSEKSVGMEGKARRHHHQPASQAGLLLRLGPRTLHDG